MAQIAEDPGESVTEGGVPEMADVGRLVRIDAGVLDHVDAVRCLRAGAGERLPDPHFPVEEDVDVPGTGHLHPPHLGPRRERMRKRLGDLPGWTPQVARQSEGGGEREISLVRRRGDLRHHREIRRPASAAVSG